MIEKRMYKQLEAFCYSSSWAIWQSPYSGNWKSKDSIADLSIFQNEDELLKSLNANYIFVGLNPADHHSENLVSEKWQDFHSSDTKRAQDYKLRYALKDTPYWGAFITDIYPNIIDTDSTSAMRKVTQHATNSSVENLLAIRDILGGKAVVVAMGTKVYSILKKNLPPDIELKMITHYSAYVNIDNYLETVLSQLG